MSESANPPDRLDSWKAIGDYLGRDIRTLQRWETQGLPVRRVAGGGRGTSVFAYRSEIDAWLKATAVAEARPESAVPAAPIAASPALAPRVVDARSTPSPERRSTRVRWRAIASAVIIVGGVVTWRVLAPSAAEQALSVVVTSTEVVASDSAGHERWRYEFPADVLTYPPRAAPTSLVLGGEPPGVFVISANTVSRGDRAAASGAVRWFTREGLLTRVFVFDDLWRFAGQRAFAEPWAITDFRVNEAGGQRRFAVAAHQYVWWPSVVTIVDANWQRQGTFVNSGWVESLLWLTPDRLAIAGFNEARDGGMVALLDARFINGSSPEDPAGEFHCETCRPGLPLSYFVFPRSELNRVTGGPFNRAALSAEGDRILARTEEVDRHDAGPLTDAIYEFSSSLHFLSASYSDRYWDRHRVLEQEGKITHTRENCPERTGPPAILMWDQANGWRTVKTQSPKS